MKLPLLVLAGVGICASALFSLDVPAADELGNAPDNGGRPVKVFILAGQSNAAGYNQIHEYEKGQAEFPPELLDQANIQLWLDKSWGKLRAGKSGGNRDGAFGPEVGFAHDLQKMMPGESIAIVKCAAGGTGIARSADYTDYIPALKDFNDSGRNWHPPSNGQKAGRLYDRLLTTVRDAVAALDQQHTKWEFAGCLWMQGEHEAGISPTMAQDYDTLLAEFIRAVRRDLKSPALPFVVGEINSHTWAFGDVARKGQAKVCREDAHTVLVKTTDLPRTGSGGASHFNADGMLVLGSRFASAMNTLLPKAILFNGKDLTGWNSERPELWRVENGDLVGSFIGAPLKTSDFLFSDLSCENFRLRFQVKVVGNRGNSGVQFWSQPYEQGAKGFQADIGPGYWGHLYEEYARGLVRKGQKDDSHIKVGDWNDYEIFAADGRIVITINGQTYMDYTDDGTGLTPGRKQVKGATSGRFGFQLHPGMNDGKGTEIRFRSFDLTLNPKPEPEKVKTVDSSKVAYSDFLGAHLNAKQKTVAEQLACFSLPKGFIIENVSHEGLGTVKPISLHFDDAGRLWTQTAGDYPKDRQPKVWAKTGTDKILVIDTPSKSGSQPARVFADGLTMPISILPYNDQVLAINGPDVIALRDTDGDGKADSRDILLSGFGVQDSHTMISRMTRTPGGWITLTQGVHCKGTVRTKTGWEQVCNDGVIARFRPNGETFEIIGEGMNNIWAWSLDRFGRTFIHEANDLGYSQVAFERDATYPSFLPTMSRNELIHPPTAQGLGLGGTGFCGIASAGDSADGFPADWRYRNFVANPITGEVHSVSYSINGLGNPTFKKLENLVTCSDKMFRPVNVAFGPDGCLYVVDWYDRTVVHGTSVKNPEVSDRMSGRIWRIRHESQPAYRHVNVEASANHELVAHLSSGNLWRMRAACHQIEFRQARELIPSLMAFIRDPGTTDSSRIHAVWALESLKHYDADLWELLLANSNQHVRYEAVRALSSIQPSLKDVLAPLKILLTEEKSYYVMNEVLRFFRDTPQTLTTEHKALVMQLRTPDADLPSEMFKGWKHTYHASGGAYEKRFLNQLVDSVGKERAVIVAFDTGKWDSVIEKVANRSDGAKLDKTIARLNKAYSKQGNAADRSNGEIQYKARCATCHDIGIAPPINSGGAKPSLEILTAVYKPNEAIEPAFRAYRVVKKDGTTLEGFRSDVTKDGIELTFMGGGKILVPASSIEKAGYLDGKSVMLSGMVDGMTDQEMIDLLHYLGAGK